MNKKIEAYKVFDSNWTCRGFHYEVGQTYTMDGPIEICQRGFHACTKLADCFSYYDFDPKNKVAKVILSGKIVKTHYGDSKIAASEIEIVEELTWHQVLDAANSGNHNTGRSNSGDCNSGDWNSGNRNSGNWNSGNWNSGNCNSGYWNSGNRNSGYLNTITPDEILVFNTPCDRETWRQAKKPDFFWFELTRWVNSDDMSDDDKQAHPQHETTGGYLKTLDYKDAWRESWDNASDYDRRLVLKLPNFDNAVFREISGIDVMAELGIAEDKSYEN